MRPCFTFKAQAAGKPAVLAIDDEIGFWGVQAKDFRASLDAVQGDDLHVEINSPGGDVFAGLGMYNMLRSFAASGKTVTTRVTGVAASIASVIMLAGDKREMPKNSFAMVHSPSTFAAGTAEDMRDAADTLDKIGASMRAVYVDRMGITDEEATAMLAKDTWLTADECLANGFATSLTENVTATAKFNLERAALPANVSAVFKAKEEEKTPEELEAEAEAQRIQDEADAAEVAQAAANPIADQIAALAETAGLKAHTTVFALSCGTLEEAKARITAGREIVALCAIAKRPDDAAVHIKANKSVADVRAALIQAQAESDVHTDGTRKTGSDAQSSSPGVVNPQNIWDSHRKQQPQKGR